jgi:FO synthase
MFGHMESPTYWARHLTALRTLQDRSGGFTEFVPLAFVAEGSPIYRRGRARPGPTFREALLMHSVSRLALHPGFSNIQASWVKMGAEGAQLCLAAGANDMGGTLMNESISRAAGAKHGQEFTPQRMTALITGAGRHAYQRSTLYRPVHQPAPVLDFDAIETVPEIHDDAGSAAYC